MRLNKYLALATGLSRRAADSAISQGRVTVAGQPAQLGLPLQPGQTVTLDGKTLEAPQQTTTLMLHKPVGYVCSRDGQGSRTVYDLLPPQYHALKPVGRLDKDSSGLLLLTNDGQLAQDLTHPSRQKTKVYEVQLNRELTTANMAKITSGEVILDDGPSTFKVRATKTRQVEVTMQEGRNRQIRRTFEALGYAVTKLHRTHFGSYSLDMLPTGQYKEVEHGTLSNR